MYPALREILSAKFVSSECRAKICASGTKLAVKTGMTCPVGAYNNENVGIIEVTKSLSFLLLKKILSLNSSRNDKDNWLAKPASAFAARTINKTCKIASPTKKIVPTISPWGLLVRGGG